MLAAAVLWAARGPTLHKVLPVPAVKEISLRGLTGRYGDEPLTDLEWNDRKPNRPEPETVGSARELAPHFLQADAAERIARQYDPERQQLLFMRWYSNSGGDRLTCIEKGGSVSFTYRPGPGWDRPLRDLRKVPYTRVFAVRKGATWRLGTVFEDPDPQGRQPQPFLR
jgi:hypothetical protein